jgi:hypothetical protein
MRKTTNKGKALPKKTLDEPKREKTWGKGKYTKPTIRHRKRKRTLVQDHTN